MKRSVLTILVLIILFGCTSPTNKDVKEEINQPYIDFKTMLFDVERNSEFDPLSDEYINDSNGIITHEGEVNTKAKGNSPRDYRFIVKYTVTSEKDENIKRKYNIQYRVKREPFFEQDGYPFELVGYHIKPDLFKELETRFILDESTEAYANLVVLTIDNSRKISLKYGSSGIFCSGDYAPSNLWEGDYELVKDNIYHVTNFKRYRGTEENCVVKESYGESYEFYFILSSLKRGGNLYYFMDYPENGYDETMNSFYNTDSEFSY